VFGWREGIGGDVGCECGGIGAGEGVIRAGNVVDCAGSDEGDMLVVLQGIVNAFGVVVVSWLYDVIRDGNLRSRTATNVVFEMLVQ